MVVWVLKLYKIINTCKPSDHRVRCYRLKHYYDLVNKNLNKNDFYSDGLEGVYQYEQIN